MRGSDGKDVDLRATIAEETVGTVDEGKCWIGGDGGCGHGAGTTQLRGAGGREAVACLYRNLTCLEIIIIGYNIIL